MFFDRSTELMLYVIGGAIAQIGNHDRIGRFSASHITDGTVLLSIYDGPRRLCRCEGSPSEGCEDTPACAARHHGIREHTACAAAF